jgi:hypothetical protein
LGFGALALRLKRSESLISFFKSMA